MQDVSKAQHQTQIMKGGKQRFSKLFMCACVNVRACETECSCVGVCSIIGGSPTAWQRRPRWGVVGGSLGERTGEKERERGGEENKNMVSVRAGREKKNKSVTEEMSTPGDGEQAGKMVKSGWGEGSGGSRGVSKYQQSELFSWKQKQNLCNYRCLTV